MSQTQDCKSEYGHWLILSARGPKSLTVAELVSNGPLWCGREATRLASLYRSPGRRPPSISSGSYLKFPGCPAKGHSDAAGQHEARYHLRPDDGDSDGVQSRQATGNTLWSHYEE